MLIIVAGRGCTCDLDGPGSPTPGRSEQCNWRLRPQIHASKARELPIVSHSALHTRHDGEVPQGACRQPRGWLLHWMLADMSTRCTAPTAWQGGHPPHWPLCWQEGSDCEELRRWAGRAFVRPCDRCWPAEGASQGLSRGIQLGSLI